MAKIRREYIDDLTGLYNRRYFSIKIKAELNKIRDANRSLSIILLDIDHFKNVNDNYGHAHGDLLLKEFALFLSNSLREADNVFRYGGDEFVCILPDSNYQQAQNIARRFVEQCRNKEFAQIRLTLSIGIASAPENGFDWQTLFNIADQNLYSAKRHGRDQVGTFEKKKKFIIPTEEIIGRDVELKKITELVESIFKNKNGGSLFIGGEVGIGKTRLVHEVIEGLKIQKAQFLKSDLSATTKSIPYYPFREIVRSFNDNGGKKSFQELPQAYQIELTKIVPELTGASKELSHDIFVLDKFRLFEGIRRYLAQLAASHPLLLFIDNIHWADDGSLEIIYYLVKVLKNNPIFFFFVYRAEESKVATLQNVLQLMAREGLYEKIDLEPLKTADVARMLSFMVDANPPLELVKYVYNETGGNPFFIEELMKSFEITGALIWRDGKLVFDTTKKVVVPNSLEGVVNRKLDMLDNEGRALLEYAAVIGREFDFTLLQDLAKIDEGLLFDLIDEIVKLKLLKESSGYRYCFSQDIIRNVIYEGINKVKLKKYHQAVGEMLQMLYKGRIDDIVEELAEHFYMGEDKIKAIEYNIVAADKAYNAYAHKDALRFYNRAIECILESDLEDRPIKEIMYLRKRANVLNIIGQNQKAAYDLNQAINKARALGDKKEEADCLNSLSGAYLAIAQHNEALIQSMRALNIYRKLNDKRGEGTALNAIGLIHWRMGDYQKALLLYKQALKVAKEIGYHYGVGACFNNIGIIYGILGSYAEALKFFRRALKMAKFKDGITIEADCLNNMGNIYSDFGGYAKALNFSQRSLRIKQEIGDRIGEASSYYNIGMVYDRLGDNAKALEFYNQALKIEDEIGNIYSQASSLLNIGNIYVEANDYSAAEGYYKQAYHLARKIRSKSLLADVFTALTSLYLAREKPAAAKKYLQNLLSLVEPLGSKSIEARAFCLTGRLCTKEAAWVRARSAFKKASALYMELNEKFQLAQVYYYQGLMFRKTGKRNFAKMTLKKALVIFKALRSKKWIKKTLIEI